MEEVKLKHGSISEQGRHPLLLNLIGMWAGNEFLTVIKFKMTVFTVTIDETALVLEKKGVTGNKVNLGW